MTAILTFERVSKQYQLGAAQGSLRTALPQWVKGLFGRPANHHAPHLWALRDVSLAVEPGEALGIIGPNGAGKTTLLKLATHVTQPTSGRITVSGRASALIQLGAGFHPDLTGRENIYLNGTILGMRRPEIQARFDEIVAFSELEEFLETPVKRYSSGMYARLGFAVAAHVNPQMLIVDEVLAVGDASFQNKCLKRMADLKAAGTAVLLVTHNLGYLHRMCTRAMFLHKGQIQADGPVDEVIQSYRDHPAYLLGARERSDTPSAPSQSSPPFGELDGQPDTPLKIGEVCFSTPAGRAESARTGAPLTIHVGYEASQPMPKVNVEVWLYGLDGSEYATFATAWDGLNDLILAGRGEICLRLDPLCLMPGVYFVNVALSDEQGLSKYDIHWDEHRLTVLSGPISHGLLHQPHRWNLTPDP